MRFDVIHNLKFNQWLQATCFLRKQSSHKPSVSQLVLGFLLKAVFGLHQTHLPSLMPNLITQFRRHYASRPGICQYVDWETTVDIKAFFFLSPAWKLLFQFTDKYFDTNHCKSYLLVLWLKWSLSWRLLLALNDLSLSCIFFSGRLLLDKLAFSESRVIYVLLICQTSWSILVVSAVTFSCLFAIIFHRRSQLNVIHALLFHRI